MPFTLDLYYLPLNDLLNIMNEYIKLKITYWNVDFINQTLDIDLIKIVSTRELRITSNDIYSSEYVIGELKNIYTFFQKYNIRFNGEIFHTVNSFNDTYHINYKFVSGKNIDTLEYHKEIKQPINNKINMTYTLTA